MANPRNVASTIFGWNSSHLPFRRTLFGLPFCLMALLAIPLRWAFLHSDDQDLWLEILNFIVVAIPFAFSIIFAFVPDMKSKHLGWRALVVLVGLVFSWILWKDQRLASEVSRRDQQTLLSQAVSQSNNHSDQSLGGVKTELTNKLDTLEKDLNTSIGKAKPPDRKFAQMKFGFYGQEGVLRTYQSLRAKEDGSFDLEFSVQNISQDVAAENIDMWMVVCDDCKYISDPTGFRKLS